MNQIEFQKALKIVTKHIKEDKELYFAYQSNIAMAFQDACLHDDIRLPQLNKIANEAAIKFLELWIK